MLVNGKMVKQMAKAPQLIQMALRMRAPTLRANEKVTGLRRGQTELRLWGIEKMGK